MYLYKQIVDEWLAEALYSARRILKKLRGMGLDGGCSIVKAYVSSRKMDLNEKATVRFETMPGKQIQIRRHSPDYKGCTVFSISYAPCRFGCVAERKLISPKDVTDKGQD